MIEIFALCRKGKIICLFLKGGGWSLLDVWFVKELLLIKINLIVVIFSVCFLFLITKKKW